jgi:hypothetical protein
MKRIMIGCLLTALLLFSLPLGASAAAKPNVSIQCASAESGGTVSVAVILYRNTGFADLSFEIAYDTSAFQLVGVEQNSKIGCSFTASQQFSQNPYMLNWVDGTSSNTFNGTLAVLTFQISTAAIGEYPIEISYYKGLNGDYKDGIDVNYDQNFDPLHLTYSSGIITVEEPEKEITVTLGGKTEVLSAKHALTGQICVAGYRENGQLCSVRLYPAAEKINAAVDSGAVRIKIFWLDDSRPVCAAKTVLLK